MRVWCEGPRGLRGERDPELAHAREVVSPSALAELRELERRGFTFWIATNRVSVDEIARQLGIKECAP